MLKNESFYCSKCKKVRNGRSEFCFEHQWENSHEKARIYVQEHKVMSKWEIKRAKVLVRDNYECQECGEKKELLIHHKDESGWNSKTNNIQKENNRMSNLITLCHACHSNIHKELKRNNNLNK